MGGRAVSNDNFVALRIKTKFLPWFRITQQKRN